MATMDNSASSNPDVKPPAWFASCADPWEFLNAVRQLDLGDRPQLLDPWIGLVNKRPRAEQDSLIDQGKDAWKYKVETIRDALKQLREAELGQVQARPTVVGPDFLADMIYNPNLDPPYQYLVYRFDKPDDPPQVVEKITRDKSTFVAPHFGDLVPKGVLLVPNGIEEYGSADELHEEVRGFIGRHLQLEAPVIDLSTTYIKYCWISDTLDIAPYLRAMGDFSAGKSTLLRVVGSLAFRPTFAAGAATAAPLFRVVDWTRGTLVLDEADFDPRSDEWAMINKILLTGHTRGPAVLRAESTESGFDIRAYDCFGPKLLGTRRQFKDGALESRCINARMPLVVELHQDIPLFGDSAFRNEAARLRNKLQLWRFRRYANVHVDPRERLDGVDPRLNAIALALLATTDDPVRRHAITKLVTDYGAVVKDLRRASAEGIVAQAVVDTWASHAQCQPMRSEQTIEFPLRTVTERVRQDLPDISPERVSSIVRSTLGLRTQYRGGLSRISITALQAHDLMRRYGADLLTQPRTPVTPRP